MKSFLVIGAGKFGHFLCKDLYSIGCDILIADESEEKMSDLLEYASASRIGDCTKRNVLATFGVEAFDAAIVCLPEDFQDSLQIVDLLKELNCPKVIAVASTEVQAKFLRKNGADRIIFPEKDLSRRLAITASSDSIFDYFNISGDCSMYEISVPSKWNGKSILEIDVRKRYGINVVAVKSPDGKVVMAGPGYVFNHNDHILVVAESGAINKIIDDK